MCATSPGLTFAASIPAQFGALARKIRDDSPLCPHYDLFVGTLCA